MTTVEQSVEVDVPVSVAYAQWTQFEEFPRFMGGVERIEQRTPTLTHWVAKVDGVRREFDAEITEQVPDERIAWTTVGGDLRQAGVVTFHRLDDERTKIMLQMDHDPRGFAEKAAEKLGLVRQQTKSDLTRFKAYIEGRGEPTGGWPGRV
ncbi:SRPBCC family protein [Streptomyces sp. NPDC060194]|uniref:SRPBCC family protein n=1 Tax=Streptomyces sp. NPDC060194 TaxID=3347069 RepID=UPI00364F6DFA